VVRTNPDSASCGYPFHVGTTFLVWARSSSGVLTTHLCDRTKPTGMVETETDLRHLRDLAETWTWRRVQADGFTLLLPEGFVPDPTTFELPEDATRWQAIWWRPLNPPVPQDGATRAARSPMSTFGMWTLLLRLQPSRARWQEKRPPWCTWPRRMGGA